jgi:hypothetical protein
VDADGLRGCAVLLEVMAGPGVHGRQRSMVSSWRKPAAWESTRPEASLTGCSGQRWSLHEGEWAVVLTDEPRRRQRSEQGRWRGEERGEKEGALDPGHAFIEA